MLLLLSKDINQQETNYNASFPATRRVAADG
jgi:hypothetical protein